MIISQEGSINEERPRNGEFPLGVRIAAKLISYVFHPLFIPLFVAFFFIFEARLFPDRTDWQKKLIFIQFVIYYTFLPLVAILLAKGVGFISSIQLPTRKDRIIPFVICEIFYFWGWYVFRNLPYFPDEVEMFGLAVFVSCSLGLIFNAYMKISMHAIALGVMLGLFGLMALRLDLFFGPYLSLALLVAGLTCTARLIDSNHSPREIYTGLAVGLVSQIAASYFV
jgi:hypothetical protein